MVLFAVLKNLMPSHRTRTICARFMRESCLCIAFLFCLTIPGAHADDAAYTRAQQRVDIGNGRYVNMYCVGSGTPTVVFESGLSDWGWSWALVQPQIGMTTRACVYDRAGLGYSDAADNSIRTSGQMVNDLHQLLQRAQLAPPYLLVGHSLGGLNVRLYADRFRDEVIGMVLVDPTHEDGLQRIDAQKNNQESRRYAAEIKHAKACLHRSRLVHADALFRHDCIEADDPRLSMQLNAARVRVARQIGYQRAQLSELTAYANGASFAEVRAARRWYGALPLVVLTASRTADNIGPEWIQLHRELAMLSRLGVQCTVTGSGHYVQLDQPYSVVAAITRVLLQVQVQADSAAFDYNINSFDQFAAHTPLAAAPLNCPDL